MNSKHFVFLSLNVLALTACTGIFSARCQAQDPPDRFVAEAGGTLDNTTGLTWGYSLWFCDEFLRPPSDTGNGGSSRSWDGAMSLIVYGDLRDSSGAVVQAGPIPYADFHAFYGGVPYDDWRLASREELTEAFQAGLFDFHDIAPGIPGLRVSDLGGLGWSWTSSTGKKLRGGQNSAYVVNLFTGVNELTSADSSFAGLAAIPVRGGSPPEDSSGSGGSNGKGKGK